MTELEVTQTDDVKKTFKDKLSDLLEEMWEKIGQHHHGLYATPGKMASPAADMSRHEDKLTFELDLPGMDSDDIHVEIGSGLLTIRGEKRDETEERGDNYVFRERRYGSFERRFMVPESARSDQVKADFERGVLTVTVPYDADSSDESTRIEVQSS